MDGCESVALTGGLSGEPSASSVRLWLEFIAKPTARNWYRAHNASIVTAYLEHRELAEEESPPERFFMNVALGRVLYAHALVAAPHLALGRFAPLSRILGDPRLGMAGAFLSLGRVLPDRYPLAEALEAYLADEHRLGRLLDYSVIAPRLQRVVRVVGRRASRATPARPHPRGKPDLCMAVRGAARVALAGHAAGGSNSRARDHANVLSEVANKKISSYS